MTQTRWLQFGALLVVAFFASVAVGAFVGRSRTAPVASVPTPTPALTATATPSPAPPSPTTAPTPPPTPLATVPPTPPPTLPPTAPPSAPPALDPPSAEDFAGELLAAFQSGDRAYLLARLHPVVFDRYRERQCRRYINSDVFAADPTASWTVKSSSGPAPWDWTTDNLTTTVNDTWTVLLEIPDEGDREVHFTPFAGTWRWFVDCTPTPEG